MNTSPCNVPAPPWFFLLPTVLVWMVWNPIQCINTVLSLIIWCFVFTMCTELELVHVRTYICVVCGFKIGRKEIPWVCVCSNTPACEQDKTVSKGREVTSLSGFSYFGVWLEKSVIYIPMSRWCWLLHHLQCILTFIIHCRLGHACHSAAFR